MGYEEAVIEHGRKIHMSKKLFLGTLAMMLATPVIVAPVQAEEVSTKVLPDFKDVPKSHSAYKEIMAMRDKKIINGYPDNTFRPAQSISRVHTASLFVRSMDLKPVRAGKEFKDVPKSSPYYNDVQTVYRAGIFDGNTNGMFGINDNLTRGQMAKVLVNAFELKIEKGYIFSDVGADNWAKDYISTLYVHGITVGSNGLYKPNDPVSRAHYAAFLYRALNPDDAPKPEKPLEPTPIPKPEPKPDPKPQPPKGAPAGAILVKDSGYEQVYSYSKSLPGGGKISEVIVSNGTTALFVGVDNKGKPFEAQYSFSSGALSYVMAIVRPELTTEAVRILYNIGEDFKSYN